VKPTVTGMEMKSINTPKSEKNKYIWIFLKQNIDKSLADNIFIKSIFSLVIAVIFFLCNVIHNSKINYFINKTLSEVHIYIFIKVSYLLFNKYIR